MNNLFTVIDYGNESNDEFITYDLWDETNNVLVNGGENIFKIYVVNW